VSKVRVKIRIDTLSEVNAFVNAVADVQEPIYIVNDSRDIKVSGKSLFGVAHASEFDDIWCECEKDIYTKIEKFVVTGER
jgi:hypothetical protein